MSALDDPVFDAAGEHESVSLIRRAIDLVETAKPLPLSSSVRVEPAELLDLLEEALERMPEEIRQARWLLKEREEFLAKVQREGDDILDDARARAERMVQRTEIVRQARLKASQTVDAADAEARRLRHEAEDYCDQQLARFEIILDRTIKTVQAGREKLQVIAALPEAEPGDIGHADDDGFFDQDDS